MLDAKLEWSVPFELKFTAKMSTINRVLREDDAVFVKKNALRLSRRHQS